jgi:prepilin-type N-terminal cleavage/methylation domain-containing protein
MTRASRQCGYSLFELAVVVVIVAVLAAVMMDRLAFYQAKAEAAAVQRIVENIRLSLRIRCGQLIASGDYKGLAGLASENPIRQLQKPPGNYSGEFEIGEDVAPGHWFYRKRDKQLVYLLNYRNFVALEGQKSLNFKVKLLRWPNESAEPKGAHHELAVVLEQVDG